MLNMESLLDGVKHNFKNNPVVDIVGTYEVLYEFVC